MFSGISTEFCNAGQEEPIVRHSPEIISEELDFGIERFDRNVGRTVIAKVQNSSWWF